MADQEWWVQTGSSTLGPMSSTQLRDLARSGRIVAETMVSPDNMRWMPAGKIDGLILSSDPGTEHRGVDDGDHDKPRDREDQGGPIGDHSDARRDGVPPGLRYPILRVQRELLRYEVIAIYETHLLKGTRFGKSLPITEEMCHPEGESRLKRLLTWKKTVDFARVTEIHEACPKKPRGNRRGRSVRSGVTGYELYDNRRRLVSFSVPAAQAKHVHTALFSRCPGGFFSCSWTRQADILGGMLFGLGINCLVVGLLYATSVSSPIAVTANLLALGCLGVVIYRFARRPRPKRLRSPEEDESEPPRPRSRLLKPRKPLRSRWLGWLLKMIAIVYAISISSPLMEGLYEALDLPEEDTDTRSKLWTALFVPVPLIIYAGYRLCQRPYDPRNSDDPRRPIVFLRPFEDDASTSLQPPGLFAALTGVRSGSPMYTQEILARDWGRTSFYEILCNTYPIRLLRMIFGYGVNTSEESLVRFFETYGHVIAIGKPGERMATPGAWRMYIDDAHWQDAVLTELKRCQSVVIQPGSSAGVRWELEQIRAHVEPFRVLFCLVAFWKNPEAYEELEIISRACLGVELPRVVPFLDRPCFLYFERGWIARLQPLSYKNPLLWPLTADGADLQYTLNPFVQGMHGGEREPPRQPLWTRGIGKRLAEMGALFLASIILFMPVLTLSILGEVVGAMVKSPRPPDKRRIPARVAQSPRNTTDGLLPPHLVDALKAFDKPLAPKAYVRKAFRFNYPATWTFNEKLKNYDPDHVFSINASANSALLFIVYDATNEPAESLATMEQAQRTNIPDAARSEFKRWGRYDGAGAVLRGKFQGVIMSTLRIFAFNAVGKSFVVTEIATDDERSEHALGFRLIEESFEAIR